jgi:hypothetical protein
MVGSATCFMWQEILDMGEIVIARVETLLPADFQVKISAFGEN